MNSTLSSNRPARALIRAWLAAAGSAALLAAGVAQAVTLNVDDDVFVNEFNNAVNMNNFTYTVIRSDGIGRDRRPLARFDLSALPSGLTGAEVSQATLRIYVRSVNSGGSVDVHRVTSAWSEGAVTWNTQPTFSGTAEGSVVLGSGAGNEYVTVDVTALVQDWVDGVLSNNGVVLLGDSIANPLATFDSKENEEEGHGMEIEVVLASNAATLCGSGELLDGDGFCVPASSVGVDTNAQTLCASSEYLDGDGNCTLASPLGDITGVSVAGGSGLTGGASSGAAVLDTDAAVLQRRVSGVCAAGSSIREIDAAGAVVCEVDDDTDTNAGTLCSAGEFLDGSGACAPGTLVRESTIHNVAAGVGALASNTTGNENTAVGGGALQSNTTANFNTAVGSGALRDNVTGTENTATGGNALILNTTGSFNTATGTGALQNNDTGDFNTAVGNGALFANTTGGNNAASGAGALKNNTTGTDNTATGRNAMLLNTTGTNNTATGANALHSNATGDNNTASGVNALFSNSTGGSNTASGAFALYSNTTGTDNTATGRSAMGNNTTGGKNTANGVAALGSNTDGSFNTAVGHGALFGNTTGGSNTASGAGALNQNTTGSNNTANGERALEANTTAPNNTASGAQALLSNTTGGDNTANGSQALLSNTSGYSNVASGRSALQDNTTGHNNTASGRFALGSNTTGRFNTGFGSNALRYNQTGTSNTAIGTAALRDTTGSGNTALGDSAGFDQSTGSNSIYIDNYGAPAESDTIRIGDTQSRAFIAGIRGVTTGIANAIPVVIDSSGQLGTVSSSARFKEDIHDMGGLSERLLSLRPVVYRYRADVQTGERPQQFGLIAEEVEQAFPELVAYSADGQVETVHYEVLGVLLLNEMQKQDAVMKAQQVRFAALEAAYAEQRMALAQMQQRLAQMEATTTQAAFERGSLLAPVAWNGAGSPLAQ